MSKTLIAIVGIVVTVTVILFIVLVENINDLKDDVQELKNNGLKREVTLNRELIEYIYAHLGKKIEVEYWLSEYKIVDLTEAEKTAKKLRQRADELEEQNK